MTRIKKMNPWTHKRLYLGLQCLCFVQISLFNKSPHKSATYVVEDYIESLLVVTPLGLSHIASLAITEFWGNCFGFLIFHFVRITKIKLKERR